MFVPKKIANLFTHRLADTIGGDEVDPQVIVCDDAHYELGEDGRVMSTATGAEAILIVRGPTQGRQAAIQRLLALLKR